MSIRLRKILYQVQMDRLDDNGNVLDELTTQEPLSLWAHQLDQLPDQVKAVLAQAEAQAVEKPAPPPKPRPQRTRPKR